jgi:hypothetical protein
MKNRNGDEYNFIKLTENTYKIVGDLDYWRFGGQEFAYTIDYNNLGFVDPSGGPFISAGYKIEGKKVKRISLVEKEIVFEVEDEVH